MPELPDLQVFSRNLDKRLAGKKLEKITVVNDSKLKTTTATLRKELEGEKLKSVYRSGKELRFEFGNGNILGMHLMLNGDLYLYEKTNEHKNTIVEMLFDDDEGLALTDFQGMANISLNPEEKPAPDALSDEVNYRFLRDYLGSTRKGIKTILLDQNIIRGIGNAYADEILWEAGISPFSIANKIPEEAARELAVAIKHVLKTAEKEILKKKPDLITGEVRDFLKIHNSRKKESPNGAPIKHETVSSRKTYYTDEQVLYK